MQEKLHVCEYMYAWIHMAMGSHKILGSLSGWGGGGGGGEQNAAWFEGGGGGVQNLYTAST